MKKYTVHITAAALALLLGAGLTWRSYHQRTHFDRTVHEALKTSEGYDQKFIDMVNRLEEVLATRASFGYTGGKDPMTGKLRRVAKRATSAKKVKVEPGERIDPFKLTAIIFDDDIGRYTAIVMVDERSYSVEVSDKVSDRVISKITPSRVYMEGDSTYYFYDISGKKAQRKKNPGGLPPEMP